MQKRFSRDAAQLHSTPFSAYGAQCAKLITKEYNVTLIKYETFKPQIEACNVKVNASVKACQKCMKKKKCG